MNPTADVRDLLAHADWLRRLAAQLVRPGGDPDDLVQQTWLAALRSPPAAGRPARPWLAEVLRNFARKGHRDRQARQRREQDSGGPPAGTPAIAAPADSLLEAAQLQRRLADLVLALDEPYRSAILLRFYQGIEPTEIARTAGIRAGTVRWRVNEGINRLRAALDSGGDTRDWRRALVPLLGTGTPASAASMKGGLLIMSTKIKLAVAAAGVAVMAIGALGWVVRPVARQSAASAPGAGDIPAAASAAGVPGLSEPATAGALARPSLTGGQPREALDRPTATRSPPPRLLAAQTGAAPAGDPEPAPQQHGTMDKEEIRRAMRRTTPALKQCYASLLEQQPQALGRLMFKLTITDDGDGGGRISQASVEPQTADAGPPELIAPLAEQCMLNAIAEAGFPAPQGGPVTVRYPFSFAPSAPP